MDDLLVDTLGIYEKIIDTLSHKTGQVLVQTYGHATIYKPKHIDYFRYDVKQDALYVQSGRRWDCLAQRGIVHVRIRCTV